MTGIGLQLLQQAVVFLLHPVRHDAAIGHLVHGATGTHQRQAGGGVAFDFSQVVAELAPAYVTLLPGASTSSSCRVKSPNIWRKSSMWAR